MDMEATFTGIVPVVGMVYAPTDRASLACMRRVYILNCYACELCLVFYKLCKPIKRPCMQAVIVFTTFSCRRADVLKLLQFYDFYIMGYCCLYNVVA